MKTKQEMSVTLCTSTSAQETCPQEEEAAASSKHNPGDPSLHVLCPAAARSLHRLSRCSSTEPEPQRHRPQPHALLGDEEVGGGCVSLCTLLCASPCYAHTVCIINLALLMHSIKPVQKDLGDPHRAERSFNCSRRVVQEPEKPSGGCCKAEFKNSGQGRGGKLRLGGGKASQSAGGAWHGSGCCVPSPAAPRLSWKQEDCRALTQMFCSFSLVIPAPCASIWGTTVRTLVSPP